MARCRFRGVVFAVAALAMACGGGSADEKGAAKPAASGAEDKAGQLAAGHAPNPRQFAFGQSVQIEEDAFVPRQLVAIVGEEVTFENRSSKQRVIEFFNGAVDAAGTVTSGTIPPGGRYSFRPSNTGSIAYRAGDDPAMEGRVQVDPGVKTL